MFDPLAGLRNVVQADIQARGAIFSLAILHPEKWGDDATLKTLAEELVAVCKDDRVRAARVFGRVFESSYVDAIIEHPDDEEQQFASVFKAAIQQAEKDNIRPWWQFW